MVILAVADVATTARFYQAAFGWTIDTETPVYVEFAVPSGPHIGLYLREAFALNTGQPPMDIPIGGITGTELYFYQGNLPEAITRLMDAGARPLGALAERAWGDDAAYFADPDGNVLVLARRKPRSRLATSW